MFSFARFIVLDKVGAVAVIALGKPGAPMGSGVFSPPEKSANFRISD